VTKLSTVHLLMSTQSNIQRTTAAAMPTNDDGTVRSRTFKVIHGSHIRRFRLQGEMLSLQGLRSQVQDLFQPPPAREWWFEYLDDEGDRIKLTEEYEFDDLLDAQEEVPVVKLALVVERPRITTVPACFMAASAGRGCSETSGSCSSNATHRALCDATDARLVPGDNWYHKAGGVDLCRAAFKKLSDEEKAKFVNVQGASDLGDEAKQYAVMRKRGGQCRGSTGASPQKRSCQQLPKTGDELIESIVNKFGCLGEDVLNEAAPVIKCVVESLVKDTIPPSDAPPSSAAPAPCKSPHAPASSSDSDPDQDQAGPSSGRSAHGGSSSQKLSAEWVASSIDAHTHVQPGTTLTPVFEIKNTSAAIWTEVRLMPTEPNPLAVAEHGVEAPKLMPGDSGLCMLDIYVPEELAGQTVTASFALVDGNGEAFGDPFAVTIQVAKLAPTGHPDEVELVDKLRKMGFSDDVAIRTALRDCDYSIDAAALHLLRSKQA